MNAPIPMKLEPYSPFELLIEWSSGETYVIPYLELRFHCPCAGCVNEHTGERMLKKDHLAREIRCTGLQVIGRYAIQFNWSDGHQTGMFHFDRLHHLCRQLGIKLHSPTVTA